MNDMIRIIAAALCAASLFAYGGETNETAVASEESAVTNITSNVQTLKQWRRQYVLQNEYGELIDPSETLLSHARGANMETAAASLTNITAAAFAGLTNGLERLWSVTNKIPDRGVTLALTMNPGVDRTNLWFYAAAQTSDGTNDVAWYYSSYKLNTMPKIQRRYYGETETLYVEGEFIDWKNDNIETNGFSGCKRVRFTRPEFARGVTLVPNPHIKIGSPTHGFDFGGSIVTVNGRPTLTGYITNGVKRLYFDNGIFKGEEDITEEEE